MNVTYAYDALDRLQARTKAASGTTTITNYDYVGKTEDPAKGAAGSTTTRYAYSQGEPLAQKLGTTVKSTRRTYAGTYQ
jgi:YD repeat-containing protein